MFTHLHNHSNYSLLDGLGSVKKYAEMANSMGHTHLAITDHAGIDSLIKLQNACKENEITPIFGVEFYIVEDMLIKEKGEKRKHIVLLAKNLTGWHSILNLVNESYVNGFYYRPRIDPAALLENVSGVIIMTGCCMSLLDTDWGRAVMSCNAMLNFKKDDIYVEVMPHQFEEQKRTNQVFLDFAAEHDLKLVATNDCHYVKKEDSKSHEVLLAVQTHSKWKDPNRFKFQKEEFYFRSRREMVESFRKQGVLSRDQYMNAIRNTGEIAEKCSEFTKIESREVNLPIVPGFEGKDLKEILRNLCMIGFTDKVSSMGKDIHLYQERFEEEFKVICEQKFVRYFLLVWEVIKWCKDNDIMTGPGRGSSAGSLMCYLLNITSVDPIKNNLIFARFISPDRIDLPDIDIDFEDVKRPLIKEHLKDLYGDGNIAGVSTFSIMRGKSALRNVSRVFDINLFEVNKACGSIVSKLKGEEGFETTIKDAFESFEEGKAFAKKYPEVARIAESMEGTVKNRGQHASAVIVSKDDLASSGRMSFVFGKDKELLINWDKEDAEYMGLMKLDVLGLNALTVLNECRKLIKKNQDIDIDFDGIDLEDEKCLLEFNKGNTVGCFQLGTSGLRKFCQRMGINCFRSLVDATALYRPGTLHSGQADVYIKRRRGEEKIPAKHKAIADITLETYGVILYQEQMMWLIYELAGLEWKVVDRLRKIVGKSKGVEAFNKYQEQFVEGCIEQKTIDESEARQLWKDLSSFGSYSFNRAHAVSYSVITFWTMYMKVNYPLEYICSLLTYGSKEEDKKTEYIEEAFRLGLDIRPPKVGHSSTMTWIIKNNILYTPFIEIKGVGNKTVLEFEKLNSTGFYEKKKAPISAKLLKILDEINAYEDKALDDDEADRINPYLGVPLIKNKLHKYKKLLNFIMEGIKITKIKDIDGNKTFKQNKHLFGIITEVKLNYFMNKKGERQTSANAILKDNDGDCKFKFHWDLYNKFKTEIEGCEGEFVIAGVSAPKKEGALVCDSMWMTDDLISAELDDLHPHFMHNARFRTRALSKCEACALHKECKAPVLPSPGRDNIMIVGEFPGRDDSHNNKIFVDKAGEILWKEIDKHKLKREDFHVSSVIKCWPSTTKKPGKSYINACSKWLEEEIHHIKPFMILAFGNTNLQFFNGVDSGIMTKSGTIEWNEKYGCWIAWSIHPSSTFYNEENVAAFQIAIEKFCVKAKNFGFIPF